MSDTIKCPFCAEEIKAEAKKCKHCGEWLTEGAKSQTSKSKVVTSENVEGTKEEAPPLTPSDWAWGCGALVIVIALIWGGFNLVRSWFTGDATTAATTNSTQEASSDNNFSAAASSPQNDTDDDISLGQDEYASVRDQLEDMQLQRRVYETCQNQEGLLAQPDSAQWPDLEGGLFSGMRRSIDVDAGTLTLRAAVNTKDEFGGDIEAIVECVYSLAQNSTTALVTRTSEASTYPVHITIKPEGYKTDLTISQNTDEGLESITGSTGYKSDRSFSLKPGTYRYRVSRFGFQTSTGTFQVPSKEVPAITLTKSPTVDVTFTSTPKRIMVNIPNVGTKVTPFTVSLPKYTNVAYQAYSSKDSNYLSEYGSLTVVRKQNYGITLSRRPVTVMFTSSPQQIKVDIPGKGIGTTPFTTSVSQNTVLKYRAFTEDGRYRSKRGTIDVSNDRTQSQKIVLSPSTVSVTFTSQPEGISVDIPGKQIRKTPFTVSLQRNTNYSYRAFSKDDKAYKTKTGDLNFSQDTTHKITLGHASAKNARAKNATQLPSRATKRPSLQKSYENYGWSTRYATGTLVTDILNSVQALMPIECPGWVAPYFNSTMDTSFIYVPDQVGCASYSPMASASDNSNRFMSDIDAAQNASSATTFTDRIGDTWEVDDGNFFDGLITRKYYELPDGWLLIELRKGVAVFAARSEFAN